MFLLRALSSSRHYYRLIRARPFASSRRSCTTGSRQVSRQVSRLEESLLKFYNAKYVHPKIEMLKQYPNSQNHVEEHYLFSDASMERLPFDMFYSKEKKTLWSVIHFQKGKNLGNTQGYVHGGLLSAVFDGCLGSLFTMSGVSGVTANLSVDYRTPVPIPSTLLLHSVITKRDGRKLWIDGTLMSLSSFSSFSTDNNEMVYNNNQDSSSVLGRVELGMEEEMIEEEEERTIIYTQGRGLFLEHKDTAGTNKR